VVSLPAEHLQVTVFEPVEVGVFSAAVCVGTGDADKGAGKLAVFAVLVGKKGGIPFTAYRRPFAVLNRWTGEFKAPVKTERAAAN
jgi:hypothetical protein